MTNDKPTTRSGGLPRLSLVEPLLRKLPIGPRLVGTSVHHSVAYEIGSRIVRGDFPEGASLPNEAQWGEYFGVSRSAVREAIKILMAKGLLSSRPKVGTWVESRDRWNLLDRDVLSWYASAPDAMGFLKTVQEFRYIIEPEAAALAAERRTEEEMIEITRALDGMGNAPTLSDRTRSDTQFHLAILKATHNELLIPLGTLIESALNNLFVYVTREANSLRYAQELHAAIEEQIRLQKPEAARQAVKNLLADTDAMIRRN
ncbi:FadR/GntR family transcriptional regulator [Rhizobium sp.]